MRGCCVAIPGGGDRDSNAGKNSLRVKGTDTVRTRCWRTRWPHSWLHVRITWGTCETNPPGARAWSAQPGPGVTAALPSCLLACVPGGKSGLVSSRRPG